MAPTIPLDYTGQRESKRLPKVGSGDMMGKTHMVSKGYPTGFVPGYRHAVETMADTEILQRSGQVIEELAVSEDTSALKSNNVGLTVDVGRKFGAKMRVFSLSKMSHSARGDLVERLKTELDQVRMFQKKISMNVERAPLYVGNPTRQNRSMKIDVTEPDRVENCAMSVNKATAPAGKKKVPAGGNGPRTKGGVMPVRGTESVKQGFQQNTNFSMLLKQCQSLLDRLMLQNVAWIFNEPVDIVRHNIPDYFKIIKHPMDLGTVKKKLHSGKYSNPMDFAADVRLTFKNAVTYNPKGHDVYIMADTMSKYFEMRWKNIEKKIPLLRGESAPSKSNVIVEPPSANMPPVKKQKTNNPENKVKKETCEHVMSESDKLKLSMEVETLLAELPDKITQFLQENCMNGGQVSEDEIEIDMDSLTDDALFKLRRLLDDYLMEKKKNQSRADNVEARNGLGFSNVLVPPQKENDFVEENVDIGGDAPPISSSTPVEIEKDAARRNSSSSSSSSSDSESGSSSSDSGSSAAAELESAKDSVPMSTGTVDPRAREMENNLGNQSEELRVGDTEQNLPSNTSSAEPCHREEGGSAPPNRQVSPDKLYRAALLRSRFADIIIKAQENTGEKGERPDSEKLKIEREELERRRREEKARLQAEAKAAEQARRRAEEEAAAEAKRKRELEREAARRALQQMEKTVDINENSQFMEDLEMFKAAPDENLQNFMEIESPENSENGLGSFKFPANSNPLEQLGLFMKNDEEEEDAFPKRSPSASDEPEEGEID